MFKDTVGPSANDVNRLEARERQSPSLPWAHPPREETNFEVTTMSLPSWRPVAPPNQAAADIEQYIREHGGDFSNWYAGIAADPRHRLFSDHNVTEHGGAWIYRDAITEAEARKAEDYLLSLGCKGGDGGGDYRTRYVYAYRITPTTVE